MNHPDDLISMLKEDHGELRQLFTELEFLSGGESLRRTLTDQLIIEMVRHAVAEGAYLYMDDEEERIFPQLSKYVSGEELIALGELAKNAKEKAPTRFTPGSRDRSLLDLLLGPGAGLAERVRDHLCGRGKAYPELPRR